jgi:hypothetical protein
MNIRDISVGDELRNLGATSTADDLVVVLGVDEENDRCYCEYEDATCDWIDIISLEAR